MNLNNKHYENILNKLKEELNNLLNLWSKTINYNTMLWEKIPEVCLWKFRDFILKFKNNLENNYINKLETFFKNNQFLNFETHFHSLMNDINHFNIDCVLDQNDLDFVHLKTNLFNINNFEMYISQCFNNFKTLKEYIGEFYTIMGNILSIGNFV